MKRGILLAIVFIILVLFLTIFVNAEEPEDRQIKWGYNWLKSNTIGRWQNLNIREHFWSMYALEGQLTAGQLKSTFNTMIGKSFENGTCFGETQANSESSCEIVETALAKIAIDDFSSIYNSNLAGEWLLNKKYIPIGIDWFLQFTQTTGEQESCLLMYDDNSYELTIDENNVISGQAGDCFDTIGPYRIHMKKDNQECMAKEYNITCTSEVLVNFVFKKPGSEQNEWYVAGKTVRAAVIPNTPNSIQLENFCISKITPGIGCDYEGTLWTAYAFYKSGDSVTADLFLPYLLTEKTENEEYLPEAILYELTSDSSYADKISDLQGQDGFILASDSEYGKYHDTALASVTSSDLGTNKTKTEEKLFFEQIQEGNKAYWSCSENGCADLRDTAMILYGFFGSYREQISPCIEQGYECVNNCSALGGLNVPLGCLGNGECCNFSLGCAMKHGECKSSCFTNETNVNYSCDQGICCKPNALSLCTLEIGGVKCTQNQECVNSQGNIVSFVNSSDSSRCCIGTCENRQQTCSELGGEICDPDDGKSCQGGNFLPALEPFCCRQGYCVQGQLRCSDQGGFICDPDEGCKDGRFVIASNTNGESTCCIEGGRCLLNTCEYDVCLGDETCSDGGYETMDADICCEGSCLKSCAALGGNPCGDGLECKGTIRPSSDYTRCCIGTCQERSDGSFPWWIIIIVVVVLGLLAFVFLRKKKPKQDENPFGPPGLKPEKPKKKFSLFGKKKKKSQISPPFGRGVMPPRRIPPQRMGAMRRPMPRNPVRPLPKLPPKPRVPIKPGAVPKAPKTRIPHPITISTRKVHPHVKKKSNDSLKKLKKLTKEKF